MRITDLYTLKEGTINEYIGKDLVCDILSLAESQFEGDQFQKFEIKIKLIPILRYR